MPSFSIRHLLLALVVFASAPARATPAMPSAATIARDAAHALERAVRADGPGAVVLIARGDDVLYRAARGRADVELDVPLAPGHVFQIASVAKGVLHHSLEVLPCP